MLRFLIDGQLPPELARRLTARGYDSRHINDTELGEASDRKIWEYAKKQKLAIFTKDVDFVDLANMVPRGPPVIWIRFGNVGNVWLWSRLEPILPQIVDRLEQGARLIELRE